MEMINDDSFFNGIIVILVGVLIYLLFFKDNDKQNGNDGDGDGDSDSDGDNSNSDDELLKSEEDEYTVSVGNPKLITRCKPLPPVKQAEKLDFGFKPAYTPNSRGNVCEKGKIDDSALFPSLTDEKVLDNVNPDGNIIVPVSSFTGDEAPFAANCTFSKPDCSNQTTTLFPGEILIKESLPVGTTNAPTDTVENFVDYYEGFEGCKKKGEGFVNYEGFIEGECNAKKKDGGEGYDNYEGFIEGATDDNTVECIMYYTDWCGYSQSALPEWAKFKKLADKKYKGKVSIKKVDCVADEKSCKAANVEGYPTIKFGYGNKVEDYDGKREEKEISSFLDDFIKGLGGH
jgi:thiol-disulfide isomerase/thioredoxin